MRSVVSAAEGRSLRAALVQALSSHLVSVLCTIHDRGALVRFLGTLERPLLAQSAESFGSNRVRVDFGAQFRHLLDKPLFLFSRESHLLSFVKRVVLELLEAFVFCYGPLNLLLQSLVVHKEHFCTVCFQVLDHATLIRLAGDAQIFLPFAFFQVPAVVLIHADGRDAVILLPLLVVRRLTVVALRV